MLQEVNLKNWGKIGALLLPCRGSSFYTSAQPESFCFVSHHRISYSRSRMVQPGLCRFFHFKS